VGETDRHMVHIELEELDWEHLHNTHRNTKVEHEPKIQIHNHRRETAQNGDPELFLFFFFFFPPRDHAAGDSVLQLPAR